MDIYSLAEEDEKFAIAQAIATVRRVHRTRERYENSDAPFLSDLKEEYEQYVEDDIPREHWPARVANYEAYEVHGNVNGGGGDMPETNRPLLLAKPEDFGFAKVYPITGPELQVEVEE